MLSKRTDNNRNQLEMVALDQLVPEDHLVRKIEQAIDFDFIYDLVKDTYCLDNGRPSIDPVVLIKMVFVQYLFGIRSMRQTIKEIETNVAMKVEETDSADVFKVSGRGELHLSILIETMRREGYELQVGKPEVVYKTINGQLCEPIENLTIEVPQEYMGAVMEGLGTRKAELTNMTETAGYMRLEFTIPARGLIGFRSELLTSTKGNGIMNHVFHGYAPYKGDIPGRTRGSLVAFEQGETTGYGIFSLQDRGVMFIEPGEQVYEGMIVGENSRDNDIDINPCKKKNVSNMRTSSSDEAIRLTPPRILSLEQAIEYINNDEMVEVTPEHIRLRKTILDRTVRGRNAKNARKG